MTKNQHMIAQLIKREFYYEIDKEYYLIGIITQKDSVGYTIYSQKIAIFL